MSLVTVTATSPLSPKVWGEDGALWARTSLVFQVLCLFFWCKHVVIDPETKIVTIGKRYFWVLHRVREVRFDQVSHIEYRHGSLATDWNILGTVNDTLESFSVDLALHDGEEVRLFSFSGEGSATTGMTGVLLGDSALDMQGDQGARSLGYVDNVQQLMGKGLSKHSKPRKYR